MKKINYILTFLFCTLLSCTNDEENLHRVTISFNPVMQNNTRTTSAAYPTDTPFRVWAYSLPVGRRWAENSTSAQLYMDNVEVKFNNGTWQPLLPYEWADNRLLTFFACSPASTDVVFSKETGIMIPDYCMDNDADLMFTRPVADTSNRNNKGCVSLPFVSAFSKVTFNVCSRLVLGNTLRLKRIYIENLAYKGTFYTQPAEYWVTTSDEKQINLFEGDKEVGISSVQAAAAAIMPQIPYEPVKLIVDIYDSIGNQIVSDKKIETPPIAEEWKAGKYYTYTLKIYSDSAAFVITDIPDELW